MKFVSSEHYLGRLSVQTPDYQHRNSHYKYKTVASQSYLYNGSLYTWKGGLYIETGPWMRAILEMQYIPWNMYVVLLSFVMLWLHTCQGCPGYFRKPWMINNFITYWAVTYIRDLTVIRNVLGKIDWYQTQTEHIIRADPRFAPNQWETALLCNDVSHWLGANLESALIMARTMCIFVFGNLLQISRWKTETTICKKNQLCHHAVLKHRNNDL